MPDIFDQLDTTPAQSGGDVFDQAAPTAKDIFDTVSAAPSAAFAPAETLTEQFAGVGRSFQRGTQSALRAVDVLGELTDTRVPTIRQGRRAFEQSMQDPRYGAQLAESSRLELEDPAAGAKRAAKAEALFGPPAKLEQIRRPVVTEQEARRFDIAQGGEKVAAIPQSQAMQRWRAASNADALAVFASDPVEIIANIAAESLPQSMAGMAAGAAAGSRLGPGGTAAGMGAGSFATEYANSILQGASDAGFDMTKPEAVKAFFASAKALGDAKDHALKRGVPIAVLDAVSAGLAGKFLAPALGKGVRPVLSGVAKEVGAQALAGGTGEALAQVVSGEEFKPKDIFEEIIGELAGAPAEVATNVQAERAKAAVPVSGTQAPEDRGEKREDRPVAVSAAELKAAMEGNRLRPEDRGEKREDRAAAAPLSSNLSPLSSPAAIRLQAITEDGSPGAEVQLVPLTEDVFNTHLKRRNPLIQSLAEYQEAYPQDTHLRLVKGPQDEEFRASKTGPLKALLPEGVGTKWRELTADRRPQTADPISPLPAAAQTPPEASPARAAKLESGPARAALSRQLHEHAVAFAEGRRLGYVAPLAMKVARPFGAGELLTAKGRVIFNADHLTGKDIGTALREGWLEDLLAGRRSPAAAAPVASKEPPGGSLRAEFEASFAKAEAAKALTPPVPAPTVGPAAEAAPATITARDERKGSGMAAEPGASPGLSAPAAAPSSPPLHPRQLDAQNKLAQAKAQLEGQRRKGKGTSTFAYKLQARISKLTRQAAKPPRAGQSGGGASRFNAEREAAQADDILDWTVNAGGVLSRSGYQKRFGKEKYLANKSLYDDAPTALAAPHHNKIFGTETPDTIAQDAYLAHLIDEPTVGAYWAAVADASRVRQQAKKSAAAEEARYIEDIKAELEQGEQAEPADPQPGGGEVFEPGQEYGKDASSPLTLSERGPTTQSDARQAGQKEFDFFASEFLGRAGAATAQPRGPAEQQPVLRREGESLRLEGRVRDLQHTRLLVRSISEELIHYGGAEVVGKEIHGPADAALLAQLVRHPQFEVLHWWLTKGNTVVGRYSVTVRAPDVTYPWLQHESAEDIKALMAAHGADGYWLVHNHPSGDPYPSGADQAATSKFAREIPGFHGHVVINHLRYALIDAHGTPQLWDLPGAGRTPDPQRTPFPAAEVFGRSEVSSPRAVATLAKQAQLHVSEGAVALFYLDTRLRIRALGEVAAANLFGSEDGLFTSAQRAALTDEIDAVRRHQGARRVLAYYNGSPELWERMKPTALALMKSGLFTDVIHADGTSLREQGYEARELRTPGWSKAERFAEESPEYRAGVNRELNALLATSPRTPTENARITELQNQLGQQDLFAVETRDPKAIEREQQTLADKAELERRRTAKLRGNALETTDNLFGERNEDKAGQGMFFEPGAKYGRAVSELGFYDTMLEAVKTWQGKGTPEQLMAHLGKTRGALEQAEWVGLAEFLKGKASVTRAEVEQFTRDNAVEVRDVVKGGLGKPVVLVRFSSLLPDFKRQIPGHSGINRNEWIALVDGDYAGTADGELSRAEALAQINRDRQEAGMSGVGTTTKFSNYQLPGGENYRELLLTLPNRPPEYEPLPGKSRTQFEREMKAKYGEAAPWKWNSEEKAEHQEIIRVNKSGGAAAGNDGRRRMVRPGKEYGTFESTHFDEPNTLAHVRFNERTDAEGNRVLFIEEVQSDWHKEGRKEGYQLQPQPVEAVSEGEPGYADGLRWKVMDKQVGDYVFAESKSEAERIAAEKANLSGVPDAPFKGTWPMLVMKRILRWGAEHGFDKVAWITGEQTAERYDLSKQVGLIKWSTYGKDMVAVYATNKTSGGVIIEDTFTQAKLPDIIGKELAQQVTDSMKRGVTQGEFAGDNLKVGGEWARALYDRTLPNEVNKFVKKWGGRVGSAEIVTSNKPVRIVERGGNFTVMVGDSDAGRFGSRALAEEHAAGFGAVKETVHSLTLTPEMKDAALGGLPLFEEGARYGTADRRPQTADFSKVLKRRDSAGTQAFALAAQVAKLKGDGKMVPASLLGKQAALIADFQEATFELLKNPDWAAGIVARQEALQKRLDAGKALTPDEHAELGSIESLLESKEGTADTTLRGLIESARARRSESAAARDLGGLNQRQLKERAATADSNAKRMEEEIRTIRARGESATKAQLSQLSEFKRQADQAYRRLGQDRQWVLSKLKELQAARDEWAGLDNKRRALEAKGEELTKAEDERLADLGTQLRMDADEPGARSEFQRGIPDGVWQQVGFDSGIFRQGVEGVGLPQPGTSTRAQLPYSEVPSTPASADVAMATATTLAGNDTPRTFWDSFTGWLRKFASPTPEIPLFGPESRWNIPMEKFLNAIKKAGTVAPEDAKRKVEHVLEPLMKLPRVDLDPNTYQRHVATVRRIQFIEKQRDAKADALRAEIAGMEQTRANREAIDERREALTELESAPHPDMAKLQAALAETSAALATNPQMLFKNAVLYRDFISRYELLQPKQKWAFKFPGGLTIEQIVTENARTNAAIAVSPHRAALEEALDRHYKLMSEMEGELLKRGHLIPEDMRNGSYFPHQVLDFTSQHLDRIRPGTENPFRGYLRDPKGSTKPIETDYVQAIYRHVAEVLAHNIHQDAVETHIQPLDISAEVRSRVEAKASASGRSVGKFEWRNPDNLPPGYVFFDATKKLPLAPGLLLDPQTLAKALGVVLTDGDVIEQMRKLGVDVTVTPDMIQQAMVAGERQPWVIPKAVAEALDGLLQREEAKAAREKTLVSHLSTKAVRLWKLDTLFAPWHYIRYEFNNSTSDIVDKWFGADPGMGRYLARAGKEVKAFYDGGEATKELRAAFEQRVLDSVTFSEVGSVAGAPGFRALQSDRQQAIARLKGAATTTLSLTRLREATFRYAKFLADLERINAGKRPAYAGAYWRDAEAQDTPEAKAGYISRKTFGDYGMMSPYGERLRDQMVPFHSWTEINFRYHANLFRNLADFIRLKEFGPGVSAARAAAISIALRLAVAYGIVHLWNTIGGKMEGAWDDDDDLEATLSAADRRRFHIILGKDARGQTKVVYLASALGDIMSWLGGDNLARLTGEWMRGDIGFAQLAGDWAKDMPANTLNKVVQSTGPIGKAGFIAAAGKQPFPDVTNMRTVSGKAKFMAVVETMTDREAVDVLRRAFDNEYYPRPSGEVLQQLVLQVRRRDPEQWAFYEVKSKVSDWKEAKTGKRFEAGDYTAPEAEALRNFRRAVYLGDVSAAERFYTKLLGYGYTSERLKASIRNQHPLAELAEKDRPEFVRSLARPDREQLRRALQYWERLGTLKGSEKGLFPAKGQKQFTPQPGRLESAMERFERQPEEQVKAAAQRAVDKALAGK